MDVRITFADLTAGQVPDYLTGVRWPDGTVECRAKVVAEGYVSHHEATRVDDADLVLLTDPSVACDVCADYCS